MNQKDKFNMPKKAKKIKLPKDEKEFLSITAKFISIMVRNSMEDFHIEHLSDTQMKELNPIIRNAIYSALLHLEKCKLGDTKSQDIVGYGLMMIPSYWEEPKEVDV